MKPIIYFLCTGNSCRSQMAEGYARHLLQGFAVVHSAGVEAHGLNPRALRAMAADGIDISAQQSQIIDLEIARRADYIITLCGDAKDRCPVIDNPTAQRLHWDLTDPAQATGSEAAITKCFTEVRDQIKGRILALKDELEKY